MILIKYFRKIDELFVIFKRRRTHHKNEAAVFCVHSIKFSMAGFCFEQFLSLQRMADLAQYARALIFFYFVHLNIRKLVQAPGVFGFFREC